MNKSGMFFLFFFVTLFFCDNGALAAEYEKNTTDMQIAPLRFDWELKAGEEKSSEFSIRNPSDRPITGKVEVEDFYVTGDSAEASFFVPDQNHPLKAYDVINWIDIEKDLVVIPAGEKKDFKFTVRVPPKIPTGGYYGALFFINDQSSEEKKDGTLLGIVYRLGVLLTMAVKGEGPIVEKGSVVDFSPTRKIFLEQPAHLVTRISNAGNIHYKAGGSVTIKRFGRVIKEIELDPRIVYPALNRNFDSIWNFGYWDFGPFEADLNVISENGRIKLEAETSFWIIPWKTVVVLIGVLLLLFTLYKLILLKGKRDAKKERDKERREWEKKHGISHED